MGDKVKGILISLGYLGIHVVSQVIITIIIGIVISIRYITSLDASVDPLSMEVQTELMNKIFENINIILLISSLAAVAVYYIIFVAFKKKIWEEVKLKKTKLVNYITAFGLGIMALFINNTFVTLLQSSGALQNSFSEFEELTAGLVSGNIFLTILVVGIIVPFVEELLFRGLILNTLNKGFSITVAIIMQGILFGIYHGNLIQGLYASFLGILYGYVVYRTRSLWTGVIMHMANNTLAVLLPATMSSTVLIILAIVGVVGVIVSVIFINKKNESYIEKVNQKDIYVSE